MKPKFSHDIVNSFFLWYDNFLMKKSDAYKTYTTKFYNYQDARLGGGKVVYGSPYKQWVYDKNITGAVMPSGLTINGSFVPTGTSGLMFDYNNGRAIFNSGVSSTLNITGTYTVKEINTYITDQPEDDLIIEGKYIQNSRFTVQENYIEPYNPVTPCCFVSLEHNFNQPFSFGGQDQTNIKIKSVVFAENLYQLDGVLSTFADSFNTCFKIVPMIAHPLGEFSQLKTGLYPTGFDYANAITNEGFSNPCFIYNVDISKIRDSVLKELNPTLHIGFMEFSIGNVRFPRI